MKYSFTCPAPCNYEIKIDAQNDDETGSGFAIATRT
jgi:hypothetical protein